MENKFASTVAKLLVMVSGFMAVLAWGAIAHRLLFVLVGAALVVAFGFPSFRSRRSLVAASAAVLLATLVSPLDLSFRSVPGPPRIVPLVMGTLNERGFAAERRGDFVGGGCIVSGFEPKWVVVW